MDKTKDEKTPEKVEPKEKPQPEGRRCPTCGWTGVDVTCPSCREFYYQVVQTVKVK